MPYILNEDRKQYQPALEYLKSENLTYVELRKVFTKLILEKLFGEKNIREEVLFKSPQEKGKDLSKHLKGISMNAGDLNYFMTAVMVSIISRDGKKYQVLNYLEGVLSRVEKDIEKAEQINLIFMSEEQELNVDGVLGCCRKELYRVITGPYEDEKMEDPKNGPVVKDVKNLGKTKSY